MSDQQHADERCCSVRRSRVVLTPRRWRQVRGCCVGPTGLRTQRKFANDGGKKARSPRRARRKPLKPLRAGMPGDSGVLVYSCAFYYTKRTRGCGCSGHPAFPTPSLWARDKCKPRTLRAARTKSYAELYQRHCEERLVRRAQRARRKRRSNPLFLCAAKWIASRSLSSGAHSRDPLARSDGDRASRCSNKIEVGTAQTSLCPSDDFGSLTYTAWNP